MNKQALINEASILAELINLARAQSEVPLAEHTVRLCEVLDKLGAFSTNRRVWRLEEQ